MRSSRYYVERGCGARVDILALLLWICAGQREKGVRQYQSPSIWGPNRVICIIRIGKCASQRSIKQRRHLAAGQVDKNVLPQTVDISRRDEARVSRADAPAIKARQRFVVGPRFGDGLHGAKPNYRMTVRRHG